jgi:hypothetical protein
MWCYRLLKERQQVYSYLVFYSLEINIATEGVIRSLTAQYSATLAICQANPEENVGMDVDNREGADDVSYFSPELKDQLCDLADAALQAHSERLQYLEG